MNHFENGKTANHHLNDFVVVLRTIRWCFWSLFGFGFRFRIGLVGSIWTRKWTKNEFDLFISWTVFNLRATKTDLMEDEIGAASIESSDINGYIKQTVLCNSSQTKHRTKIYNLTSCSCWILDYYISFLDKTLQDAKIKLVIYVFTDCIHDLSLNNIIFCCRFYTQTTWAWINRHDFGNSQIISDFEYSFRCCRTSRRWRAIFLTSNKFTESIPKIGDRSLL